MRYVTFIAEAHSFLSEDYKNPPPHPRMKQYMHGQNVHGIAIEESQAESTRGGSILYYAR